LLIRSTFHSAAMLSHTGPRPAAPLRRPLVTDPAAPVTAPSREPGEPDYLPKRPARSAPRAAPAQSALPAATRQATEAPAPSGTDLADPPAGTTRHPAERQRHAELAERGELEKVSALARRQAREITALRQEAGELRGRLGKAQEAVRDANDVVKLRTRTNAELSQEVQVLTRETQVLTQEADALQTLVNARSAALNQANTLATQRQQSIALLQGQAATLQQQRDAVTASRDQAIRTQTRASRILLGTAVLGCSSAAVLGGLRQVLLDQSDAPLPLAARLIDVATGLAAGIGLLS